MSIVMMMVMMPKILNEDEAAGDDEFDEFDEDDDGAGW